MNTSDNVIDNWAIEFSMPYEMTNIWNGVIDSFKDGTYVIKNAGSNQDIEIGQTVSFGFSAVCNDANIVIPAEYTLLMSKVNIENDTFQTSFKVTNDWKDGFNGTINIKNCSKDIIEDWIIEFDFSYNITKFYTANIISHEGNHYIVKNAGYNSNIKPEETLTLGFDGNPGNVISEPINFKISQIINEKELDNSDIHGMSWNEMQDSDNDAFPDQEEKRYGTDYLDADTDKDGLPDGYELQYSNTNPMKKINT